MQMLNAKYMQSVNYPISVLKLYMEQSQVHTDTSRFDLFV